MNGQEFWRNMKAERWQPKRDSPKVGKSERGGAGRRRGRVERTRHPDCRRDWFPVPWFPLHEGQDLRVPCVWDASTHKAEASSTLTQLARMTLGQIVVVRLSCVFKTFSSVLYLYPLKANSKLLLSHSSNVSRCCQAPPGGQTCP